MTTLIAVTLGASSLGLLAFANSIRKDFKEAMGRISGFDPLAFSLIDGD